MGQVEETSLSARVQLFQIICEKEKILNSITTTNNRLFTATTLE